MLPCEGGALQLIDTPPVVSGLAAGQGAGRPLLHLFSGADMVVVVVDLTTDVATQFSTVLKELGEGCIRPIPTPVPTVLRARGKGGIKFLGERLSREQEHAARGILAEAHVEHAEVITRTGFDAEVLQNQVDGDVPMPTVVVGTHAGDHDAPEDALRESWPENRGLEVDTDQPESLEPMPDLLLETLGLMRIRLLERASDESQQRSILVHRASDITAIDARSTKSGIR